MLYTIKATLHHDIRRVFAKYVLAALEDVIQANDECFGGKDCVATRLHSGHTFNEVALNLRNKLCASHPLTCHFSSSVPLP